MTRECRLLVVDAGVSKCSSPASWSRAESGMLSLRKWIEEARWRWSLTRQGVPNLETLSNRSKSGRRGFVIDPSNHPGSRLQWGEGNENQSSVTLISKPSGHWRKSQDD